MLNQPQREISLNDKFLITLIMSLSLLGESEVKQTITNRSLCLF